MCSHGSDTHQLAWAPSCRGAPGVPMAGKFQLLQFPSPGVGGRDPHTPAGRKQQLLPGVGVYGVYQGWQTTEAMVSQP